MCAVFHFLPAIELFTTLPLPSDIAVTLIRKDFTHMKLGMDSYTLDLHNKNMVLVQREEDTYEVGLNLSSAVGPHPSEASGDQPNPSTTPTYAQTQEWEKWIFTVVSWRFSVACYTAVLQQNWSLQGLNFTYTISTYEMERLFTGAGTQTQNWPMSIRIPSSNRPTPPRNLRFHSILVIYWEA